MMILQLESKGEGLSVGTPEFVARPDRPDLESVRLTPPRIAGPRVTAWEGRTCTHQAGPRAGSRNSQVRQLDSRQRE